MQNHFRSYGSLIWYSSVISLTAHVLAILQLFITILNYKYYVTYPSKLSSYLTVITKILIYKYPSVSVVQGNIRCFVPWYLDSSLDGTLNDASFGRVTSRRYPSALIPLPSPQTQDRHNDCWLHILLTDADSHGWETKTPFGQNGLNSVW
jgi:hypothetical protein